MDKNCKQTNAYSYNQAVVRRPGYNFSDGLKSTDSDKPSFRKALAQYNRYCRTLKNLGLKLTVLEANQQYPDGCFVEDTVIATENVIVITIPGAASRKGEQMAVAEFFKQQSVDIKYITSGTVDGGDVLRIADRFYIGQSARTSKEGASQLSDFLKQASFETQIVEISPSPLHLKSGVTYVGNDTVIGLNILVNHPVFERYKKITVPEDEAYAANCLLINGTVLFPTGYPKTRAMLKNSGYQIAELPMSEFAKMDGGLTCMSVPFSAPTKP